MSVEHHIPSGETYECEIEYGPSVSTMQSLGTVKFVGLSTEFLSMIREIAPAKLWVSRSLEASYITKYFTPYYGLPVEYLDLVPSGESRDFTRALSAFNGAGLIITEVFTMIIFQPTNDKLRGSFKTPMQRIKTPLRGVLYPPINVKIPTPCKEPPTMHPGFDPGFDSYEANLLVRLTGCHGKILGVKVPPQEKKSYCITYCPELAKAERIELEQALRQVGHRIVKINDTPELERVWKRKLWELHVFVHSSLQYQLHLLPHIKTLRRLQPVSFRFFGLSMDRAQGKHALISVDRPFWKFGTIILLTPKFIVNNETALAYVLAYQKAKAGSTVLCVPKRALDRAERYLVSGRVENVTANNILKLVYQLQDRIVTGDAIYLPIDGPSISQGHDLEPGEIGGLMAGGTGQEIDVFVDRFAQFHLEKCDVWRKWLVCHSVKENVVGARTLLPTVWLCGAAFWGAWLMDAGRWISWIRRWWFWSLV